MKIHLHEYEPYIAQFALLEERFLLLFNNPDEFYRLLEAGAQFTRIANIELKLALVRSNFFSLELLQALISGGVSYKTGPINYIWRQLKNAQIMLDSFGNSDNAYIDHSIVLPALLNHLCNDTFQNIMRPPSALVSRYRNAIVAIDVKNSEGIESRGTGFIIRSPASDQNLLITCRHNVDPNDGLELLNLTTSAGTVLTHGNPQFFGDVDLCVYPLTSPIDGPVFRLSDMVEIFDEVYTFGYPLVPGAHPDILGHRGELNGKANMFIGGSPLLIISNLISPGSSGGPVLDSSGHCIGMSIRWLEAKFGLDGDERARFSAAIPGHVLISLLEGKVPPDATLAQ